MSDGLVLLDKPAGPTSHDLVAGVRKMLGGVRVGHTGTLDPAATGLLIVLTGRSTRLARYLPHEPKTYVGRLVLGVTTSTDDLTGTTLARHEGAFPPPEDVANTAAAFTGRSEQVPPAVSAKRVAGKRLYRLARAGRPSVAAPVEVRIDRFGVAPTGEPAIFDYELVVSSGTYVRAAVRDLGRILGCGASVATLRRISIGPWGLASALPWPSRPDDLRGALIGLEALPLLCPRLDLVRGQDATLFAAGTAVPCPSGAPDEGEVAVRSASGALLGIGEVRSGLLCPKVVLAPIAHPEPV